jgi:hypothetical protein
MRCLAPLALLLAVLAAPAVYAQDRSHHRDVTVKPIRKGGQVVGATITLVLHDAQSTGRAHIALAEPKLRADSANGTKEHNRAWFIDPEKVVLLGAVDPPARELHEATFEVLYGQGNKLKGGEKLDVVSSWGRPGGVITHNWGAVYGADRPNGHVADVTLPSQ